MKDKEVAILAEKGYFRKNPVRGEVLETHISWVILSNKFAFKIKKPLSLSFLDFSTLSRRKKFCEKEKKLNKRFSSIYLSVLPVRKYQGMWYLGKGKGKVMDYAVQMKRLSSSRKMDTMLKEGSVSEKHIHALAKEVATFHKNTQIIKEPLDIKFNRSIFNDIRMIRSFVLHRFGKKHANYISESIAWSDSFLTKNRHRIEERIRLGFKRDGHGDLHSGNIFLYKRPVLFDCIEFSDRHRQIDVLSDVAFFCMDMEAFGRPGFASLFMRVYNQQFPAVRTQEDRNLFVYYKCFRANVRAKVHAMSARESEDKAEYKTHLKALKQYLTLMNTYMESIPSDY